MTAHPGPPSDSDTPRSPKHRYLQLAVFGLVLAGVAAAAVRWWPEIWLMVRDSEHFKRVISSYGAAAPLAFIAAQVIQVVIFFVPGEVTQIAGGYIFGTWKGLLYSYIGIALGSLAAFYFARLFEHAVVDWLVDRDTLRKFDRVVYGKSGFWPMFILFLLPGIPKDLLCYIAGLTPMPIVRFLVISTIGRLPGVLLSTVIGHRLEEHDWRGVALLTAIAVGFIGIAYVLRGPLERFRRAYLGTEEERLPARASSDTDPEGP